MPSSKIRHLISAKTCMNLRTRGDISTLQHLGPTDGMWGFNQAIAAMVYHIWLPDEEK